MATYVIRAKYFGYNDEVFYIAGNRIANIFDNKQQAEATYKQLEIDGARDFALYEVDSLFEADEEKLRSLDEFVFSRCGEHILDDDELSMDILPVSLNDEDTFEFVQLAEMQKFQLVQFDQDAKFYGLWSMKKQQWLEEHDEGFAGLVYSENPELLGKSVGKVFAEYDDCSIRLAGSLSELSAQPVLLKALIGAESGLSYDENKQELIIDFWQQEALYAVNPLLKQPLFAIREISLEDIQRIEKDLARQYGYEEYDEE